MVPRTLRIRGHIYKIRQVGRRELGSDEVATVDNERNIIQLYKRSAPSRKIELIFHEVIHAMLFGYGLQNNEDLVVMLGEAITEFIKANPSFIRHALKTLNK